MNILLLKMFWRYRVQVTFIALSMAIMIASMLGALVATNVASSEILSEILEKIPVQVTLIINMDLKGSMVSESIDTLKNIIKCTLEYSRKLESFNQIKKAYVTTHYWIVMKPGYELRIGSKGLVRALNSIVVLTFNGSSIRVNVTEGRGFIGVGGVINVEPGDTINLTIYDTRVNKTVYIHPIKIDFIYNYASPMREAEKLGLAIGGFDVTVFEPVYEPSIAYNTSGQASLLASLFKYIGRISVFIVCDIVLSPGSIPLYSPDAITSSLDKIINDVIIKVARETLPQELVGRLTWSTTAFMFGFIPPRASITWSIDGVEGSTILCSPLYNAVSSLKTVSMFQSMSVVTGVALPIIIASWYMVSILAGLLAEWSRRFIALASARGVSLGDSRNAFFTVVLISAMAGAAASIPLSYIITRLMALIMGIGGAVEYAVDAAFNYINIAIAMAIAVVVSVMALRRVLRYVREAGSDLSLLTRVYVPPLRERWSPGLAMRILLALSIVKYGLWATGTTLMDLFRMASGNPMLFILVAIYAPLDVIMSILAPFIITYFLVMASTHSERVLSRVAGMVTRGVSGELCYTVKDFILRGSTRLYKTGFVIALIVAVLIVYLGSASSMDAWYPGFREWLGRHTGIAGPIMIYDIMFRGTILSSRMAAYYSIFLAIAGAIMMTLVLLIDMDKELSVLRARGGGVGMVSRFVYGVVFTILVISLVSGLASGLLWLLGKVNDATSSLRGLSPEEPPPPMPITFSPHDIMYIILVIALLFILPIAFIMNSLRRPVAEKLRTIV